MTPLAPAELTLRHLAPDDDERMARLFYRLSPDTIYRRFMTHYSDPHALRSLLAVDGVSRAAIIATDPDGEIVGVARYAKLGEPPAADADGTTAEVAVLVQDEAQGRGIGLGLLTALAGVARANGVHRFTGTMLSTNEACARLFRRAFPDVVLVNSGGETTLDAQLSPAASFRATDQRRGTSV